LLCYFSVPQALKIGWMYGPVTPTSGRCKMTMPSVFPQNSIASPPIGNTLNWRTFSVLPFSLY
jgi:hypothetical protein